MNGSGRQRQASYRLLLMTLWATLLVFVIELTAGWISHSLCLLAEALHTLIDVFSTLLSLVAIASPQRTLGKEIWGHGRSEAAGALILSAVMGFTGVSIILIALDQFLAFFQTTQTPFQVSVTRALIVLVASMIALMLAVAWFVKQQSQENESLALKLSVRHILKDSWLTIVLFVGLVMIYQGYRWLDPALAILLVVMSVRSLWRVLQAQLPMLLKPTAIAPEAIAQIACQTEGVTRCTRILSRGMVGRQIWIELHIAIHPEYMAIAGSVGAKVERSLREHYGPVR
ncbi:MAG: cation diffusion facilitator family transporter, partial [Cyanobacteria bacterium J06649_4]